jgi:hypothetical protein
MDNRVGILATGVTSALQYFCLSKMLYLHRMLPTQNPTGLALGVAWRVTVGS